MRNITRIKKSIKKMEHYKISNLLNDSTVLKILTKQWIQINNLWKGQYSLNKN